MYPTHRSKRTALAAVLSLLAMLLSAGSSIGCPWDCADPPDGEVNVVDFLALIAQWGQPGAPCDGSLNGVDVNDFLALIANWGPCPEPECPDGGNGDTCTNAIPISDESVFGSTIGNSGFADDTSCSFDDTIDEWYCYVATCNGGATASTCSPATTFDTTLAVFDGCFGPELACNDDLPACDYQSQVTWEAEEGHVYLIRVAGYLGDVGNFQLTVACGGFNPACPGSGGCCVPNSSPGCSDPGCCDLVCAIDTYCCDVGWDTQCANTAFLNCVICQ